MKRIPTLLAASGLAVALFTVSCTTLGTHVKGGFACRAPVGTCAPMSNIDAQAIAGLGTSRVSDLPIGVDATQGQARFITTGGEGVPVRTGEHVMRVVFPAHTDAGGVFHEEAVAHLVTDRSVWTLRQEEPPTAGSLDATIKADAPGSRGVAEPVVASTEPDAAVASSAPLNLREAAAGLIAAANPQPDPPRDAVAVDVGGPQGGAPSAEALAAARAGHRIGDTGPKLVHIRRIPGEHTRHGSAKVAATVPGAATAALNRAVLRRLAAGSPRPSAGAVVPAAGTEAPMIAANTPAAQP